MCGECRMRNKSPVALKCTGCGDMAVPHSGFNQDYAEQFLCNTCFRKQLPVVEKTFKCSECGIPSEK